MMSVLDDTTRRLRTSELHDPGVTFNIFICNEPWRMWLYSQRFDASIGAVADNWLTRNIYLREADVAANRLSRPTAGWPMPTCDRSLTSSRMRRLTSCSRGYSGG